MLHASIRLQTLFLPPDFSTLGPKLPDGLLVIFLIQLRQQLFFGAILDLPGRNNAFLLSTSFWFRVLLGSVKHYAILAICSLGPLHLWYPLLGALFCLITAWLTLSPLWVFSQMPLS